MSELPKQMDHEWITSILPHRYPMLFVDRVLEIEAGKRIVAIKNVTSNEEVFLGHFPDHPVVPGVLLVEGLAQAGAILLLHDDPDRESKIPYFMTIEKAKFRQPAVPGDQLRYEIEVLRRRPRHCRLQGRVLVGETVVAEAICTSAMVSR